MKRENFRVIAAFSILFICGTNCIVRAAIAYTDEQKLILKQREEAIEGSLRFQQLEPNDVNNIELCIFDWEKEKKTRLPGQSINKEAIEGLLTLSKKAAPSSHSYRPRPEYNYIMIVKLKEGDTFKIPFDLKVDFGRLDSRELMEALYVLTNGCSGNIIHFNQGKVQKYFNFSAFGGRASYPGGVAIEAHVKLNKEGEIILTLKMMGYSGEGVAPPPPRSRSMTDEEFDKLRYTMNQSKPVRYGQAQVFEYNGEGYMIVDVFNPLP